MTGASSNTKHNSNNADAVEVTPNARNAEATLSLNSTRNVSLAMDATNENPIDVISLTDSESDNDNDKASNINLAAIEQTKEPTKPLDSFFHKYRALDIDDSDSEDDDVELLGHGSVFDKKPKAESPTAQPGAVEDAKPNYASSSSKRRRALDSDDDDSDDEDDELLFGRGSVFDKKPKTRFPKLRRTTANAKALQSTQEPAKPAALTKAKETIKQEEGSLQIDLTQSPSASKKCRSTVEAKPDALAKAKEKVKQEGSLKIDLTETTSDSKKILSTEEAKPAALAKSEENVKQEEGSLKIDLTKSPSDSKKFRSNEKAIKMDLAQSPPSDSSSVLRGKDDDTKKPLPTETKAQDLKEECRYHLNSLNRNHDRALQLLLWEIGFTYSVYAHQFEAIRFVAGLVSSFPIPPNVNERKNWSAWDSDGAQLRRTALEGAALEFTSPQTNSSNNNTAGDGDRYTLPTKGMLLADEMGLGKTIEALAGAALRSAIMSSIPNQNHNVLPTLIVSPQDGIQNQWYETLVKSGVPPSRISVWGDTKQQSKKREERCSRDGIADAPGDDASQESYESYILCTRYNIQSELRRLFNESDKYVRMKDDDERLTNDPRATTLFHHVPWNIIWALRNQYLTNKGKEKNQFLKEKEKSQDCVARLVNNHRKRNKRARAAVPRFTFHTIIVDEAHFCKNVLAYWGLGLALLGTQSSRTVLLTGTPYNNGPSDMTSLMTYIDPSHAAAKLGWWDQAVSCSSNSEGGDGSNRRYMADAVSQWRKAYLLRRTKDVLLQKLPPRLKRQIDVAAIPSELWIYQAYEGKFMSALRNLRKDLERASPEARFRAKKVFEAMMACMACMRMALVHPILPGGREMTIHFSPSRRHLLKREERPNKCVFCNLDPTKAAREAKKREIQEAAGGKDPFQKPYESHNEDDDGLLDLVGTARTEMDLDDDRLDDDDFEDSDAKSKKERELEEKAKGPIIPLGPEFCKASGSSCRHFAHEKCIEKHLKDGSASCPRCHDLKNRLHANLEHNMYCLDVQTHVDDPNARGFTASAKIEKAIEWFQTTVPKSDKAIFLSFFKGSLDLIEGILVSKFGIDCARYDGDVSKEARTSDLQRFKTSSTCRVLLATVQSGGTGLNITEANHVCFLDRWFNPCVHDQAESRCHRIGQKKDVNIAYLDINFTIDIVMKRINILKEGNANVILADGTSLGDRWSLGYQNVSGVIGNTMKALREMREKAIKENGDAPLPPYVESDLEMHLGEMTKPKAEVKVKPEIRAGTVELPLSNYAGSFKSENGIGLPVKREQTVLSNKSDQVRETKYTPQSRSVSSNSMSATLERARSIGDQFTNYLRRKAPPSAPTLPAHGTGNENISFQRHNAAKERLKDTTPQGVAQNRKALATLSGKRPASMASGNQLPQKRSRFSHGLSAINAKKKKTLEAMRRKRRGDL